MPSSTRTLTLRLIGRKLRVIPLLAAVLVSCLPCRAAASESQPSTQGHPVDQAVRAWMQTVAQDVTRNGPLAWLKYFETGPEFFMAVNGQMAFRNRAAAEDGTRKFAQTIRQIELKWGDDLRVDPLTTHLAAIAVSWREIQVDTAGHRVDEKGYFTALAEYRDGRWQFRNAHWSAPVSPGP